MKYLRDNLLLQFSVASFVIVATWGVLLAVLLTQRLSHDADLLADHGAAMMAGAMIRDTDPYSIPHLLADIDNLRWTVLSVMTGGFVLLYGSLVGIVWRGWTTINQQQATLKRAQVGAVESARLAAVGSLVSGVAHELNNPLSVIYSLTRPLDDRNMDAELEREMSMVHNEAERSVRIVRNLLDFAQPGAVEKTRTSINNAVEAVVALRKHQLELENIELEVQLQPDLPSVMADSHEIQQVIFNLILNAEQAIADAQPSGRIVIKTEEAGQIIRLMVSDDGPGSLDEHLPRLFDPFFTTKEVGKGTGLGLSISYGIIKGHGGIIRAERGEASGMTFTIELPGIDQQSEVDGEQALKFSG